MEYYIHNEWKQKFSFFSHHIIVKSSKCQPRCNITIYWKGIDLLGYGGDDILSLAQKTKTFTSNQIYLRLVYINELHLNIKWNTISVSQKNSIFCCKIYEKILFNSNPNKQEHVFYNVVFCPAKPISCCCNGIVAQLNP